MREKFFKLSWVQAIIAAGIFVINYFFYHFVTDEGITLVWQPEAGKVHDTCGKSFVTVTPGVRFADGDVGDQKRVMTPAEAKKIGSDYIVVGRPITAAEDPVAAYERCCAEFIG